MGVLKLCVDEILIFHNKKKKKLQVHENLAPHIALQ